MEFISHVIRVSLPGYLQSLPVPGSLDDVKRLSGSDWLSLLPFALVVLITLYSIGNSVRSLLWRQRPLCNPGIRKSEPKVTDSIIRETLGDKVSFCRCWRSEKWPYCDGSHKQYNRETGDNVGALVIKSKDWKPKPKDKDKHKK